MPLFEFQAKKSDGSTISGEIEANDEKSVAQLLLDKKLYPLVIKPQGKKGFSGSTELTFLNRVTVKDLVLFSRQLAVMSEATIPLVQSLKVLVEQTENVKLKGVIAELATDVDGGSKFSQALARHPKVFSEFFISMVRSGETSGRLDEVLNYLADQQERDYDLMSRIRGAMIYPVFIVCGIIVVGIVMMVFVIPKLTGILTESGVELPIATKLLIGLSSFLINYWWLIIILLIGAVLGAQVIMRTPAGKRQIHLLMLKIPVFGNLLQRIYLVRLTRSLVTLIQGGVPLPQALDITADVVGNEVYRTLVRETKKEVDDGNPLAGVFLRSKEVPVMVSQMMNLGEQTGRLDKVLEKLTAFYTREITNLVENLVSLIEPLIMVVMGVAVGIMVAAIIMPMYQLASAF